MVRTHRHDERGIGSILTVVFFILVTSVVTIGFMRLSLVESEQSLEDSLSKAALAAAHSGVNDAKRALLYCEGNITADCTNGLVNQSCPGFYDSPNLRAAIGMPNPVRGAIAVGGAELNERYTCVVINKNTTDVRGSLSLDDMQKSTTVMPLRGVSAFNTIRLSWGLCPLNVCSSVGGLRYAEPRAAYRSANAYGSTYEYGQNWPSVLKASVYSYPGGGISYNPDGSTNIATRTTHLFPAEIGGVNSIGLASTVPRESIRCSNAGFAAAGARYSCQLTITGFNSSLSNVLQLSSLYTNTDYAVELFNGPSVVAFENVNPTIDSTGAVEDIYRRIKVRVRYQTSTPVLSNALDLGGGICKDFIVGQDPNIFSDNCTHY